MFGIDLAELKRPDLLVNLEGRTEFESEAVDDVTTLHQKQGRAVQFLKKKLVLMEGYVYPNLQNF